MTEPLISVIIPVYNGERYIAKAIQSVFDQHYPNIEIIVVNDGSTDQTLKELQQFGDTITVISQENKGQAVARNVGIKKAKGTIIGLLDGDDVWTPDHIALTLPYIVSGEYSVVRGYNQKIYMDGDKIVKTDLPTFMNDLVGACLYTASLFTTVGLFDETMREGEDFDWNTRINESNCKQKIIPNTILLYRRHDTNMTNHRDFFVKGQLKSLRNKLERAKQKKS